MARLLVHDDLVPARVRSALETAYEAPPDRQSGLLESAARLLHEETHLQCEDVRELFGFDT